MKCNLVVNVGPHTNSQDNVSRIMWEVNLSLLPALFVAVYVYGTRSLFIVLASVLGAILGEFVVQKYFRNIPVTIWDGSAIVTGILLAFCIPVAVPLWIAFIGGLVSIVLGKQCYGGLGQNIFNPAHVGRAILLASWPVYMTTWIKPFSNISTIQNVVITDGITTATPLAVIKETIYNTEISQNLLASSTTLVQYTFSKLGIGWKDLLIGTIGGSLGETSKIALIVGGLYLLLRRHISLHIPFSMIGTVFIGALIYSHSFEFALFYIFSGGLILGAFFMATDMVTSPMTQLGHIIFGIGCGIITLLIRLKGGYPEGVCYSILIMNAFVPLIDRITVPKKFGTISVVAQSKEAKA